MEFLETSDFTDEFRMDETCLKLKMKKHYRKLEKSLVNKRMFVYMDLLWPQPQDQPKHLPSFFPLHKRMFVDILRL